MDDQTGENFTGGMDSPLLDETIFEHTLDDLEMFCREQEAKSREAMLMLARMHPEMVAPVNVKSLISISEDLHRFTKSVAIMFRREAIALRAFRAHVIVDGADKISRHRQFATLPPSFFMLSILLFLVGFILGSVLT